MSDYPCKEACSCCTPGPRAKVLGLHRSAAVQWQQASGGDWMAYAADVAERNSRTSGADQVAPANENSSTTSHV
ncbi:hypothetical protein OG528_28915 [Streptomyces platensis]|uniref:hypothetical protein n=1 Tax=Streptomyces platensis TaxID=58346 RepID=UPI00224E357E|nr:hypothetical protein [Streptomyces platensis]MCX4635162.1 hypothetical protein [Streptomyces platensis]